MAFIKLTRHCLLEYSLFERNSIQGSAIPRVLQSSVSLLDTSKQLVVGNVRKSSALIMHEGASGLLTVLPVSAESAGLLPNRRDDINGSDLVLEAITGAEVARNAKEFFSQPQNQIKPE